MFDRISTTQIGFSNGQRSKRYGTLGATFSHAALAAVLVAISGTPCAYAQMTSAKPANKPQAQQGSGTSTFTNQPSSTAQEQPSMQSAFGRGQGNAQPTPPSASGSSNHSAALKGAKGGAPGKQPVQERPALDMTLNIDDNNIVDLHVNNEDLGAVLQMLSMQSQRNIIPSKNVSGSVTANLYGVTFYEALDAILNVNGYGYIEDGNFIYVYTLDEIGAIIKSNRIRVSKVITLSYLSAIDAAEFAKPLLSETGQIKTNGKTPGFPTMGDVPQGNEEFALGSTLVVYDYEENVSEIDTLVKQLDTRPAQVLVEATILQTTLNEANAFGVDFAIVADMTFGDFITIGGPTSGPNALIAGGAGGAVLPNDGGGTAISSTVGNAAGAGGLKVGVVSNDVAIFLRVLDEVTDSTVLSNPKLLALNRQGARVLVGRKVGYLSTTSTDTATTQTVEFLDTGTQLYFRPFVDSVNRTIRMELKPQVSEAVIRDVKNATGAALTVPDEITNELSTNVIVRDGQTIVLGGLFRESTITTRRQIPVLGDIPLLGNVFRGNEDTTERTEIIFLITPSIVNDGAMAEAGERGKEFTRQAQAGAREGTLKWSRDRLTTQLNVEAQKLLNEGETDKALWKIERSLSLDSSQAEIIAMRERVTGQKSPWPSRSTLEYIIRDEATNAAKKQSSAIGLTYDEFQVAGDDTSQTMEAITQSVTDALAAAEATHAAGEATPGTKDTTTVVVGTDAGATAPVTTQTTATLAGTETSTTTTTSSPQGSVLTATTESDVTALANAAAVLQAQQAGTTQATSGQAANSQVGAGLVGAEPVGFAQVTTAQTLEKALGSLAVQTEKSTPAAGTTTAALTPGQGVLTQTGQATQYGNLWFSRNNIFWSFLPSGRSTNAVANSVQLPEAKTDANDQAPTTITSTDDDGK